MKGKVNFMALLSENIKTLRKQNNMTQKDLADFLGVHVSSVCKYESGAAMPTPEAITRLAKFFGVSTDYLYGVEQYALGDDVGEMKEMLKSSPEFRVLFDIAKNATPAEIKQMIAIHNAMKATNNDFWGE